MKQSRIILMLGLLSLILALGGLVPGVVAQDSLELESLSIALWPEFDQPEMLVIYQGSLAPETALPAAVEIRIPARVGRPTAMAFLSAAGERLNQQYTTRVEGEFVIVSFELTATGFQLEYYDDLPVQDDLVREYDFAYTADYAIADLSVEFQLPRTGEGLTVEPQEGVAQAGTDGLLYHRLQREAVEAAETMAWTFRYEKRDDELTNPPSSQAGAVPTQVAAPAGTTGDDGNSTVLIFVVAFVALIAVGAAAFWLGRNTRLPAGEPAAGAGRSGRGPLSQRQALDVAFCYKCGAELRPDADFCHKCGAPVRG